MSPIGRIFIVVNLGLAVAFLGWASANLANANKYKTWYEEEKAAKEKLDTELNGTIQGLQTELNQKSNDNQSLVRDKGELDSGNTRLQSDLDQAKRENSELRARLDSLDAQMTNMSSSISDASSKAQDALGKAQDAQDARHSAEQAQVAAEEKADELAQELDAAQQQISDLEVSLNDTKKMLADAQTTIDVMAATTGVDPAGIIAQMPIDGAVVMVSYDIDPGVVLINRGKADNVRLGYTFDIYKDKQYKGRVRVTNVHENTCSAVIEKLFEGRTISQGDSASTNI